MLAFSINFADRTKIKIQDFFCGVVPPSCYSKWEEWLYYFNVEVFLLHSAYTDVVLRNVLSILLKFMFVWMFSYWK